MPIHLQFEGGFNFRDLGEFKTSDGKTTKPAVFIRCGNHDKLTESAQEQLLQYGVTTIIDLRTVWECENFPSVFVNSTKLQYKNLPLLPDSFDTDPEFRAKADSFPHLYEVYRLYIDKCQPQIAAIFQAIAESHAATAFHCYVGKDRTGIIAALLLSLVGVSDESIASDYAETNAHITHLVSEWYENVIKENRDLAKFKRDSQAVPETILETLAYIRENYGSISEYLLCCGLTPAQLEQIRNRFI
jgi:protein-tyrosine phosphatase